MFINAKLNGKSCPCA